MTEKYTGIKTYEQGLLPIYMAHSREGCVIAFDTETTGLHNHDDVIQLAYVVMEDGTVVKEEVEYLLNTVPVDGTEAQSINGITDEFLRLNGKAPFLVLSSFVDLIEEELHKYGKVVLCGHNLPFDLRMLHHSMERNGVPSISRFADSGLVGCDTKEFLKALNLPKDILPNNKLSSCIDAFALDASNSHDALDDTKAVVELFKFLTSR